MWIILAFVYNMFTTNLESVYNEFTTMFTMKILRIWQYLKQ